MGARNDLHFSSEGHFMVKLVPRCALIASKTFVLHKQNLQSHPCYWLEELNESVNKYYEWYSNKYKE
jgi:hypothetical protein